MSHAALSFEIAENYIRKTYASQLDSIASNIEQQSNLGNCELNVDLSFAVRQHRLVIQRIFANLDYNVKLINMTLELSWA